MFRETSETTTSAPKTWTTGEFFDYRRAVGCPSDQVQVAPKEDYEPLIFLEPVGKLGVFFFCFGNNPYSLGCPPSQ